MRAVLFVMVGTPIAGALIIGGVAYWLLLVQPFMP
jgi:hypothetical protein